MLHSVLHQFGQLLPFCPVVQVLSLLADLLVGFTGGVPVSLPAQPSRPLHAFASQQRVLRLVTGR